MNAPGINLERLFFKIKKALKRSNDAIDEEIKSNIDVCLAELERVGISVTEEKPLIDKCCELYCKAQFNFDNNSERFQLAFEKLRDSLSLSAGYKEQSDE